MNFLCRNPFCASSYYSQLPETYYRCLSLFLVQCNSSYFLQTSFSLQSSSTSRCSSIRSSIRGTLAAVARFASFHTTVRQNLQPSASSAAVWPIGSGRKIKRGCDSMRRLLRLQSLAMVSLSVGWSAICSWRPAPWSGSRPPSMNCSPP